jgi:hypothetical protein
MIIEKIKNGYLLTNSPTEKYKADDLLDVFEQLLFFFEGKKKTFLGKNYGKVEIHYEKTPNINSTMILSEKILNDDWTKPEENEAWKNL